MYHLILAHTASGVKETGFPTAERDGKARRRTQVAAAEGRER